MAELQKEYTIVTPNQWNSNEYTAGYAQNEYWDLPGKPIKTAFTAPVWIVLNRGPRDSIISYTYITDRPGVKYTSYNTYGNVIERDQELQFHRTDDDGNTYYYWNTIKNTAQSSDWVGTNLALPDVIYCTMKASKIPRQSPGTIDPYIGYGTGSLGGDVIGVPQLPTVSAVNTGLVTIYNPTESEMRDLADYLWTSITPGTDTLTALKEIAEAVTRLVADPMKVILGLSIVPSSGLSVSANRYAVQAGLFAVPGCYMHRLTSQYYSVDCGTLQFSTVCGDTFLDYSPYSKFQVYLPFIGIVHVDANDFVGHTIGVKYNIDALSGACTAFITKDSSVMYTYSGNVALNIPLSSESWSETWSAALGLVSSAVTGGVAGNTVGSAAGGIAKGAAKGIQDTAANLANNPSVLSPSINRSGAIGGSSGFMGVMTPFVIREAVQYQTTSGMNELKGYPLHSVRQIGSCSGYTVFSGVHLDSINATSGELDEIERLLSEGVIL